MMIVFILNIMDVSWDTNQIYPMTWLTHPPSNSPASPPRLGLHTKAWEMWDPASQSQDPTGNSTMMLWVWLVFGVFFCVTNKFLVDLTIKHLQNWWCNHQKLWFNSQTCGFHHQEWWFNHQNWWLKRQKGWFHQHKWGLNEQQWGHQKTLACGFKQKSSVD